MKHRSLVLTWLAASGAATALGSPWAIAADTPAGAQSELLQEIVVYGRARDETTLDVPQSVDVFNAEILEAIGSDRVGDALRFVPGASSDGSKLDAFGDSYLIRGFGADQTVNGIGVNQLNHSRDAVSVERIEVLKGPASVLYGQLQPGAVVNVVTKQPERTFGAQLGLEAGRYDFYRGTWTSLDRCRVPVRRASVSPRPWKTRMLSSISGARSTSSWLRCSPSMRARTPR